MNRRVYVSMPADQWLAPNQNSLKWKVVDRIEELGYIPEVFSCTTRYIKNSIASPQAWSPGNAYDVASRCVGAVIIGLPRWKTTDMSNGSTLLFASDFCQYEGSLFKSLQLPTLVLAQNDLYKRGVFDYSFGSTIGLFEGTDDGRWLNTDQFMIVFDYWKNKMYERRDVFLGYCSRSTKTANEIKQYLVSDMNISVLDWQTDFAPGSNILQQIQEAAEKCAAGIFLFTKDDFLENAPAGKSAVPRDNVIFEAGYFIKAKNKSRVLVILEEGAKMPADLGGDIYASLENNKDVATIKNDISKFLAKI